MNTTTTTAPADEDTDTSPAAPSAHTSLDTYLDVIEKAGIPVFGYQVWWRVFEGKVVHTKLEQAYRKLGLPPAMCPKPPRDNDAFESATGNTVVKYPIDGRANVPVAQRGRRKVGEKRAEAELSVQHVARDDSRTSRWIERHVVRKVTDEGSVKLDYKVKLATAIFQYSKAENAPAGSGGMTLRLERDNIADLDEFERKEVAAFIKLVKTTYEHRRRYVDAKRLRNLMREFIELTGPVQFKPGLYFVPAEYKELLDKLAELAGHFGKGSYLKMFPLPELDETRDMIIEAFIEETKNELNKLSAKLTEALEAPKPSPAVVSDLTAKFQKAKENAEKHAARLKTTMSSASAAMQAVEMQVAELNFKQ